MKLPRTFDAPTKRWFRAAIRRSGPFASKRIKRDYNKVVRWLRSQGVVVATADIVALWGPAFIRTDGGTMNCHKVVVIAHRAREDKKRLFLVLHEAGHIIQYRMGFRTAKIMEVRKGAYRKTRRGRVTQTRAETMAYLFGSALAEHLRIRLDQRAWRNFNWEARRDKRRKR